MKCYEIQWSYYLFYDSYHFPTYIDKAENWRRPNFEEQ